MTTTPRKFEPTIVHKGEEAVGVVVQSGDLFRAFNSHVAADPVWGVQLVEMKAEKGEALMTLRVRAFDTEKQARTWILTGVTPEVVRDRETRLMVEMAALRALTEQGIDSDS